MRTTRFITMHDAAIVQVRPQLQEAYASGIVRITQEQILVHFRADGVLPHERQLALDKFAFRGLFQEQDEVTTVAPDYRIGLFDSDRAAEEYRWSPEIQAEVDDFLSAIAEKHEYLLVAPRSPVPPPWPRYDDYQGTVPQLMKKLVSEGHDVQQVLVYEQTAQDRPQVVEALEQLLEDPERVGVEEVVG